MSLELLEIQPRELKFLFELKKQSSCCVRLVNKFNDYVAFKVKTTSPKKYCVRPNVGIIKPKSVCEFIVTMQAPKLVPTDMICKDKFLVQSTAVPAGTTDDDITSSTFSRDNNRYVEEVKLRVILLTPPNSPVLSPINGMLKQEPVQEASAIKDQTIHKLGSFTQSYHVTEDVAETKANDCEVVKPANDLKYKTMKEVEHQAEREEYESMMKVEDPSRNMVNKTVQGSEDPVKDGPHKTLIHVNHEEDPVNNLNYKTTKVVEHLAEDVEYGPLKEAEDPSTNVVCKPVKGAEDPVTNGDHKTWSSLKDEEGPTKNGDEKTLKHAMDEEDLKNDVEYAHLKTMKHLEQSLKDTDASMEGKRPAKDSEYSKVYDVEVASKDLHHNTVKGMEESNLVKDIEEMKLKLDVLESKLAEAEDTISKLTEERRWKGQERETLRQELAVLRSKRGERVVQVGFPFLFVCMVALVSIALGYALHG